MKNEVVNVDEVKKEVADFENLIQKIEATQKIENKLDKILSTLKLWEVKQNG